MGWDWYRQPARIAAALPALPDLSGKPAELRERMQLARTSALSRSSALDGVAEFGRLCQANGLPAEAEACWRLILAEQPRSARSAYYLADLRRVANDYEGMAEWLTRTVRLDPTYAPAWLHLADLEFKRGRLADAERAYQARLALLRGDPHACLGIARVALQQGRRDEAREQIERLVKEAPEFPPGHNLYAEILATDGDALRAKKERWLGRETGRFREAADPWLDELVAWCFDYEQLCIFGTVDFQTKHGDRGKSSFERAIQLRPDGFTAYSLLGTLYLDGKDPATAREIYEQGLRNANGAKPPALYYVNLSRAFRELKQPADAVRVAREGIAQVGEQFELYDALGTALGDLGEREAAVEALRTAVARNAKDANANYNLAVALLAVHRLDEAVEALRRSLALHPTFPSTLALLAQIEIDSGRWQDAAQYLQPLYESHPEMPQASQMMVYWHLRAGSAAENNRDFAAAEQHYRDGLAIERNHAELQSRLGTLCLIQGRFADAVAPLEELRRLQPGNAQGALFLGQAYAAVGRRDEARQILLEGVQVAERAGNTTTAQHCREILEHLPPAGR
jgi:HemY protein